MRETETRSEGAAAVVTARQFVDAAVAAAVVDVAAAVEETRFERVPGDDRYLETQIDSDVVVVYHATMTKTPDAAVVVVAAAVAAAAISTKSHDAFAAQKRSEDAERDEEFPSTRTRRDFEFFGHH